MQLLDYRSNRFYVQFPRISGEGSIVQYRLNHLYPTIVHWLHRSSAYLQRRLCRIYPRHFPQFVDRHLRQIAH